MQELFYSSYSKCVCVCVCARAMCHLRHDLGIWSQASLVVFEKTLINYLCLELQSAILRVQFDFSERFTVIVSLIHPLLDNDENRSLCVWSFSMIIQVVPSTQSVGEGNAHTSMQSHALRSGKDRGYG